MERNVLRCCVLPVVFLIGGCFDIVEVLEHAGAPRRCDARSVDDPDAPADLEVAVEEVKVTSRYPGGRFGIFYWLQDDASVQVQAEVRRASDEKRLVGDDVDVIAFTETELDLQFSIDVEQFHVVLTRAEDWDYAGTMLRTVGAIEESCELRMKVVIPVDATE